jgi:hypothetical protein
MADTQEAPVHALLEDGTTAAASRVSARRAAVRVAEAGRHPGYRTPAAEHEGRFVWSSPSHSWPRRVRSCAPVNGRPSSKNGTTSASTTITGTTRTDRLPHPKGSASMSTETMFPLQPARLTADLDPRLSRRLWLVKRLLALPHRVVLVFLRVAFVGVSVAALFPIPLTVRCPRALFDVNAGVPAVPLDQGGPEPEGPS